MAHCWIARGARAHVGIARGRFSGNAATRPRLGIRLSAAKVERILCLAEHDGNMS
jgi:hypothetical protein